MIKNEQWTVKILIQKVLNNEIHKPKYQRQQYWVLLPKKEKKEKTPSDRKYIEFLFETRNSVHAITFGHENDKLSVIDGNNRLNAIIRFINQPFILFPEKLDKFREQIKKEIMIDISKKIVEIIVNIKQTKYDNSLPLDKLKEHIQEKTKIDLSVISDKEFDIVKQIKYDESYPLDKLKEHIRKEKNIIDIFNKITDKIVDIIIDIVKEIKYDDLIKFKYFPFFSKNYKDLYKNHLKYIRDTAEPYFEELINEMKIDNEDRFDNDVIINVNLFIGYSTEELARVFGKINQYDSRLTENDALASKLFNIDEFIIEDKVLEIEIRPYIKEFYNGQKDKEELICHGYKEDEPINAFDFMIGFQNYSNNKCCIIQNTDDKRLSLFFKIYKNLYKETFDVTFTTKNVNEFISYMKKVINILQELENRIFTKNLVKGKNTIFDAANKKLKSLEKNNMYLIITSIIGYIKNKTDNKEILKSIEKCILYHFFISNIDDKDERKKYQLFDGIAFEAGGTFIDNQANSFIKDPSLISKKITPEIMEEVLIKLTQENVKNKTYEVRSNGNDKLDKRRNRKLFEKILISTYYYRKIPREYLQNNFWVEHIFPFSSSWDSEIDIDRLGNIIPIIDILNKDRNNHHIEEYKKNDKNKILNFIDIIPKTEKYNSIISHTCRKPHVINSEEYNKICINNERILIKCFLEDTL